MTVVPKDNRSEEADASYEKVRPLISFTLFAYNQESYIRSAVEGAFAQTYQNLEIILSDDCSTDRTFEIMEGLVQEYSGPHRVILNRNDENLGLTGHINRVLTLCRGEWVVFAAGDDISRSDRVEYIAGSVKEDHTAFVSEYDIIELNSFCGENKRTLPDQDMILEQVLGDFRSIGIGATYAYRLRAILPCMPMHTEVISEDRILPVQAAVYGRIFVSEERLVYRRELPCSLSKKASKMYKEMGDLPKALKALYLAHDEILDRAKNDGLISNRLFLKFHRLLADRKEYWRLSLLKSSGTASVFVVIKFWYYSMRVNGVLSILGAVRNISVRG